MTLIIFDRDHHKEQAWVWRQLTWHKGKVHLGLADRGRPYKKRKKGVWYGETDGGGVILVDGRFLTYARADNEEEKKQLLKVMLAAVHPQIEHHVKKLAR